MTRIQGDKYYTPLPIYQWLSDRLKLENKVIFDPCCGKHRPTYKAFSRGNRVIENDIDRDVIAHYHGDAAGVGIWLDNDSSKQLQQWTITNPPYNGDLLPILDNALQFSSEGVAMLLRLTFLEPTKNRRKVLTDNLWGKRLKAVYPVNPRPRFDPSKSGTDNVTVAWFIWVTADDYNLKPFDFCTDWNK